MRLSSQRRHLSLLLFPVFLVLGVSTAGADNKFQPIRQASGRMMIEAEPSWHPLGDSVEAAPQGSEVALYIPWPVFSDSVLTVLKNYTVNDQEALPDQTITVNELNWQASGITSTVTSGFVASEPNGNSYPVQSRNLAIGVTVQKLSIDQIVLKTIGSATVKVHIQAVCNPIQLVQTAAQARALISYTFSETSLSTDVSQFNLAWPANSWKVGSIVCQGPSGLDQELKNSLVQQLQTADAFKAYIQQKLSEKIQTEVDAVLTSLKSPTSIPLPKNPLPLRLNFSRFVASKSGLLIFGRLDWSEDGNAVSIRSLNLTDVPTELQGTAVPQLITLNHSWEDILESELVAYNQDTAFDLNSQPSFQELLESRVKQFFVWPDLHNYNGQSKFFFQLHTPSVQNISWQGDGSAQATVVTSGWIQSQRALPNHSGGALQTWNYVLLNGTGQAKIQPAITHGLLTITAVASGTALKAKYGDEYVKTYSPNTYLAPKLLDTLKSALEKPYIQSVPLPAFSMGPLGSAKLNGWRAISNGLLAVPVEF